MSVQTSSMLQFSKWGLAQAAVQSGAPSIHPWWSMRHTPNMLPQCNAVQGGGPLPGRVTGQPAQQPQLAMTGRVCCPAAENLIEFRGTCAASVVKQEASRCYTHY